MFIDIKYDLLITTLYGNCAVICPLKKVKMSVFAESTAFNDCANECWFHFVTLCFLQIINFTMPNTIKHYVHRVLGLLESGKVEGW